VVITREADYAVRLMLAIAECDSNDVLSARMLSDDACVPYELARGLLSRLADAGLLQSTRGRNGGFRLARRADSIRIGEILRVAGEDLELNVCVSEPESCSRSGDCPMHDVWTAGSEMLRSYIAEMTLAAALDMEGAQAPRHAG
jgi:Rrf2 family protein